MSNTIMTAGWTLTLAPMAVGVIRGKAKDLVLENGTGSDLLGATAKTGVSSVLAARAVSPVVAAATEAPALTSATEAALSWSNFIIFIVFCVPCWAWSLWVSYRIGQMQESPVSPGPQLTASETLDQGLQVPLSDTDSQTSETLDQGLHMPFSDCPIAIAPPTPLGASSPHYRTSLSKQLKTLNSGKCFAAVAETSSDESVLSGVSDRGTRAEVVQSPTNGTSNQMNVPG